MADGSIRIDTRLNNKEIAKDLDDFSNMAKRTANNIKRAFNGSNNLDGLKNEIKDTKQLIKDNEKAVESYQKRLDNIDAENPVKEVQNMVDKNNNAINKAKEKIDEYQEKLDSIDAKKEMISRQAIENSKIGMNDNDFNIDRRVEESLSTDKDYQKLLSQEQEIISKMDEYSQSLKKAQREAESLSQKLSSVKESASSDLTSGINDASKNIENANKKLGYLESKIKGIKSNTESATKSAKKFGDHISSSSERGIKKIAKMALAIFSVRSAYTFARKAADEYLQTNEYLSNQVQGIWNAIAQAVGPVVEKIIGYVVTLIGYVNAFIKALTGIDLVARGNAAALKKQASATNNVAKETEKANRQLASFDEMNKLNSDSSDSDGGSSVTNIPTLEIDSVDVDGIKEKFEKMLEPLKNAWSNYGEKFTESFNNALSNTLKLVKSIGKSFGEVWLNGTGEETCSLILQILTNVFDIIGYITGGINEAWNTAGLGTSIIQHVWDSFNDLLKIVKSVTDLLKYIVSQIDWTSLLKIIESITGAFSGLLTIISRGLENIIVCLMNADYSGAGKALSETFKNAVEFIRDYIKNVDWFKLGYSIAEWVSNGIKNIMIFILSIDWFGLLASVGTLAIEGLKSVLQFLAGIVGGYFKMAYETMCAVFSQDNVISYFTGVRDNIVNALSKIGTYLGNIFLGAWSNIKNIFNVESVKLFFKSVLSNIQNTFANIPDWFKSKFSQAWQNVKKVFSSGGKIFDGIKDGILTGLKSVINALISGINRVISIPFNGLNSALNKIRSVNILGLKPFSGLNLISVPQIPKLARGGIVNNPGQGVNMGDYIAGERGAEAIVPLENSDFIKSFAKEIAMQLKDMNQPVTIVLQVGDKEFYKWFINLKRKYDFVTNGG